MRVTGAIVLAEFRNTVARHGIPASTLTDNGMVFTTRLAGGKGGRNAFESELRHLGITQINSTPHHPTTCGKVERFHQTLKKWLTARSRATTSRPRHWEEVRPSQPGNGLRHPVAYCRAPSRTRTDTVRVTGSQLETVSF